MLCWINCFFFFHISLGLKKITLIHINTSELFISYEYSGHELPQRDEMIKQLQQ